MSDKFKNYKRDYTKQALNRLRPVAESLNEFTRGCRIDMHEPDENGIKAQVVGSHLDNALDDIVSEDAIKEGFQEFVVILINNDGEELKINLATLIALARLADINMISARNDVTAAFEHLERAVNVIKND